MGKSLVSLLKKVRFFDILVVGVFVLTMMCLMGKMDFVEGMVGVDARGDRDTALAIGSDDYSKSCITDCGCNPVTGPAGGVSISDACTWPRHSCLSTTSAACDGDFDTRVSTCITERESACAAEPGAAPGAWGTRYDGQAGRCNDSDSRRDEAINSCAVEKMDLVGAGVCGYECRYSSGN